MRQRMHQRAAASSRQAGKVVALDVAVRDPAAARLLQLVSRATGVPDSLLRHRSRCTADVAEARQLAMYLMHVVLQRTYEDIGRALGRERTTVSYACAVTEDRRDDPDFEDMVAALEAAIGAEPEAEAVRAVA